MTTPLKQKRKEQILRAALKVFGEEGFHNGTVEDIAIEAGLGKGTIYEYFASKQEIFEQMILNILKDYLNSSKEIASREDSIRNKLIALLKFDKTFLDKNVPAIEQSIAGLQNISDDFRPLLKALHESIFEFIIDLVREAKENGEINRELDERLLALLWINIINGLNNSAKMFNVTEVVDPEKVVDILYKSIK